MTSTMWSTVTVLTLFFGISGCFPYYRGDWRGHRYDGNDRAPRYADTDRDPPGRDCWREGNNWACRR
jgi:hypothetical protein